MKTVLRFLKPYKRLCVLTLLTMLVDAAAALLFGLLYDKKGVKALVWSTVISGAVSLV